MDVDTHAFEEDFVYQEEKKIRLLHEVRNHLEADLSARLVHLWRHSSVVGVCDVVPVRGLGDSSYYMGSAPLCGAAPRSLGWLSLGGDTRSFL